MTPPVEPTPTPDPTDEFFRSMGLPDDPRDLLTPEEHDALNQHLEAMARQRRQVEAESRDLPLATPPPTSPKENDERPDPHPRNPRWK